MSDSERERFEAWARGRSPGAQIGLALHKDGPQRGEYIDDDYEWAWIAWQAALAAPPAQAQGTEPSRDTDWILAIGHALGKDSGYIVPIVPEVQPFRDLFDAIRKRAVTESAASAAPAMGADK